MYYNNKVYSIFYSPKADSAFIILSEHAQFEGKFDLERM